MSRVLRVQGFATIKGSVQLMEAFGKWLVEIVHRCPVELWDLCVPSLIILGNELMNGKSQIDCLYGLQSGELYKLGIHY
jgi:hypothetical protein